ncbi:S-adenosylmethionine:tRNA ribosyltransferase-isomerase [Sesbania bispinosa]|nr:S-adenosylmethionine:tRNA ribosyltransferase-isomerase [Sesbania bispinosa]
MAAHRCRASSPLTTGIEASSSWSSLDCVVSTISGEGRRLQRGKRHNNGFTGELKGEHAIGEVGMMVSGKSLQMVAHSVMEVPHATVTTSCSDVSSGKVDAEKKVIL